MTPDDLIPPIYDRLARVTTWLLLWLSTHLLVPSLMASLASLAIVFYLVYKDGLATWALQETITAILAGAYSAVFIVTSVINGRKYRRAAERQNGRTELEAGRGAPQIPEVEG
ncbi:uncharacterized protein DNG_02404 [Cephalotrichum gorgonifer]|uniref:Uncharacterized protein n=1 Tax=Cephalotrichum gorgonifer TaxID=2041049 RepID=A0AAE8MSC8_9PEZI|nr:uncharacterized protein DNG_02404 [Cephalotrichum gorgonifer]